MKVKFYLLCISLLLILISNKLHANEIEVLKKNFVSAVLSEGDENLIKVLNTISRETISSDQVVMGLMQRFPRTDVETKALLSNSNADGSWTDIDYKDQSLSGWKPFLHAERSLLLAKVYYQKSSSYYHSKEVLNRIHASLNYWFNKKPYCKNWWYNQIGVPKALGQVFLLMEDELTTKEKEEAIVVLLNSKNGATGQNKVWLAGNVLMRGLLQNDLALVKQCRDIIASEMVMTGSIEGIQLDHSFHQHGAQQQFGNYGAAFISDMSFWSKIFAETSLAIEQQKLDILADLITLGYQRVIWKGFLDVNGLGRQYFKNAQQFKAFSAAFASNGLKYADAKNKTKYTTFLTKAFSAGRVDPELKGVYHFWNSDQTVARNENWMASVKMASSRVIGAESLNGDNLKGFYTADGAIYTYVDGDEYKNIFPLWDWRKIPGVTAYETEAALKSASAQQNRNKTAFVGNVTDGNIGLTTMQLKRDKISALKSYVFTDNFVFCLAAGIATDSATTITTTIDQRVGKSDLNLLKDNKWITVKTLDLVNQNDARFFSDKTGYIVLDAAKISARNEIKTGAWADIMRSYPFDMLEKNSVISLWLDHGKQPENANYQYFILPSSTQQITANFNTKSVEVLANTKDLQIVYLHNEKVVLVSTLKAAEIKLPFNGKLKSSQAGLFLIKYEKGNNPKVIFNDPTQELTFADYEINGLKQHLELK